MNEEKTNEYSITMWHLLCSAGFSVTINPSDMKDLFDDYFLELSTMQFTVSPKQESGIITMEHKDKSLDLDITAFLKGC